MKLTNKIKLLSGTLVFALCSLTTSCEFLDVVPVEQPELPDATKDAEATLGFLYSCYAGIRNPIDYTSIEGSADEYALPQLWAHASVNGAYDLSTPKNCLDWRWGNNDYRFIGQSWLFLQELENARGVTEEQKQEWTAEAKFLIAYYHFDALRFYGPCPVTDSYIPMDTPNGEYHGRYHYDYVTNWVVDLLDEAIASGLPNTRSTSEFGRATTVIAKALKARVLLYAASPLWNGKFPDPDWKNKNFETPDYVTKDGQTLHYGMELVSRTYDASKWTRALKACQEAIEAAEAQGYELYDDETMYTKENVPLPYIPGIENESEEGIAFRKKVLLYRYLATTRTNEGNKELIWGLDKSEQTMTASLPTRILKLNNGNWYSGYSGVSPYLYTIEHFYTKNGKLPAHDPDFPAERDWLKSAGVSGRQGIINLCIGREPRFYAWMAFDDGDYSSMLANGQPLQLKLRDSQKQGYNPGLFNRDHCVTGFLSQKYVRPNLNLSVNNSWNLKQFPRPLIRLAELYLNLAECQAATGDTPGAIRTLNRIRQRAGVPELTAADVNSDMTITEWVRNERFIELWGEGQRFYDIRRWVEGPKYLSAGKREGLNAEQKLDPAFEEYNQRIKVNQPYQWQTRMYLAPVFYNEVYKNPQMVQAPGY